MVHSRLPSASSASARELEQSLTILTILTGRVPQQTPTTRALVARRCDCSSARLIGFDATLFRRQSESEHEQTHGGKKREARQPYGTLGQVLRLPGNDERHNTLQHVEQGECP